jgi:nucleoside-diphosphate-sugar epimerase
VRLYAGLYETPAIRVVRLANVYGPGDTHWSRIVPGSIRRTVEQEAPRITAGRAGEALREYVFLNDALEALVALARVAFNIGSPHRR